MRCKTGFGRDPKLRECTLEGGIPAVWFEQPPRPNTVPELGILLTDVLDSHPVQVVPAVTDVWTRAVHSVNQNPR